MHPDEAFQNFNKISEQYEDKLALMNEAETRAKVIDSILKECLGWHEDCIRREDHVESGYTDYQLLIDGITRIVIEAKRAGDYFEIPKTMNHRTYKVGGVIQTVSNLIEALQRARTYSVDIGCKYAAVFNGHQLVVFTTMTAGIPWKDSHLTIFNSFADIKSNFNLFWNMLAYDNVRNGSLVEIVDKGKELISFRKVISGIHNPDQVWARNELYTYIHPLVSLVFSEILDEQRAEILKSCYVFERSNRSLGDDLQHHFVDKLPHFAENFRIKWTAPL